MKRVRLLRALAVLLTTSCAASCSRVVTTATTTPATWAYVEDAWGGLAIGAVTVASGELSLPLKTGVHPPKRFDSAVCIRRSSGRVDDSRILILLESCVCGPGVRSDLTVEIPKPEPGTYSVVYDDAAASFPKVGEVVVK